MKNIPKPNFHYWLLMIIATTTGEIVGNYISRDLGLGYEVGFSILFSLFIFFVFYTLKSNTTSLLFYWFLILLGNIGGTNVADLICIDLHLGTIAGSMAVLSLFFVLLILMTLISRKTDMLYSRLFQLLYWLAILTSSTFGTTSGDFLSNDTPLGAAGGTILLLVLLAVLVVLHYYKKLSPSVFYWIAIILIHPIGATFGNYISKPAGLNFGNVWTSIVLILLFFIVYAFKSKGEEKL
ncbi:hypothetical protein [Flavobacterium sp.]